MIRKKSEHRTPKALMKLLIKLDSTKMHLSGFLMIELARESWALDPLRLQGMRKRKRGVDS